MERAARGHGRHSWAGMGRDDDEAVLLEEPSQDANSLGQDPEERLPPDDEEPNQDDNNTAPPDETRLPKESLAPRRRWGLPLANLGPCR